MLDKAKENYNFGLKAFMYMFSHSQDKGLHTERANEFNSLLEQVLVNRQLPQEY